MSLPTLLQLRTHIKTDPALSAWLAAHYTTPAMHWIGYKKPVNANDYPSLCYLPVRENVGKQPFDTLLVSLIISLNEKGVTEQVFDGVTRCDEAAQLVVNRLLALDSPMSLEGDIRITTDLGLAHPLYEIELQMTVMIDQASIATDDLADFATLHADYDIDPFQAGTEHDKWLQEPPNHTTSQPELTDSITLQEIP
jgi:hypothetical protein